MDTQMVGAEVFNFMKTSYLTALGTMTVIQDQAERALNSLIQQGSVFQDEGKKILGEWINTAKKNRTEYQKLVEENLKKAEEFFFKKTTK